MVGRIFRAALVAAIAIAVWTFARPAGAASLAPFCDDRGATAIAAPPTLEAPDEAVRRTAAAPCASVEPIFGLAFRAAHRPSRAPSSTAERVCRLRETAIVCPPADSLDFVDPQASPPFGVRARVERPPRTKATRAT